MSTKTKKCLGLDIGTNSIAGCLTVNTPTVSKIIDAECSIFSNGLDAKTNSTKNQIRTSHRLRRRQTRNKMRRISSVRNTGTKYFGYPELHKDRVLYERRDPYALRVKALYEEISEQELIRIFVSLAKRRGYRLTREALSSEEGGAFCEYINKTKDNFIDSGYLTIGEYLFYKRKNNPNGQVRNKKKLYSNNDLLNKLDFDEFITRDMIEHEFNFIWEIQSKFKSHYTDELKSKLHHCIFFQRNKYNDQVGFCSLEAKEKRAPKAHPVSQYRAVLANINNIRIIDSYMVKRSLTSDERKILEDMIMIHSKTKILPFKTIYKKLNLLNTDLFTIDDGNCKGINIPSTNFLMSNKSRFGNTWNNFSLSEQSEIFETITDPRLNDTPHLIEDYLKRKLAKLTDDEIGAIVSCPIEKGYTNYSVKASNNLIPLLSQGISLYDAEHEIYGRRSTTDNNNIYDKLPYYGVILPDICVGGSFNDDLNPRDIDPEGFYGKIPNPVVHAALNQTGKLTNKLISKNGKPDHIVLELARELKSSVSAQNYQKNNLKNAEKNNAARKMLEPILGTFNIKRKHIDIVKLWEELPKNTNGERVCVYSGTPISLSDALEGGLTNIDHIIPKSRSLNDTLSNKILCTRSSNFEKGNKTPDEMWFHDKERWSSILERARCLPPHKYKLFTVGSFDDGLDVEPDDGFLPNQLKDTQYIAVAARRYLSCIFERGIHNIEVIYGQTVNSLRNQFPVEAHKIIPNKDRNDHRHHFVDAALMSIVSKKRLQKIFKNKQSEETRKFLLEFSKEIKFFYDEMIVRHKPEKLEVKNPNMTGSYLHKETFYGHTGEFHNGNPIVTYRKNILDLKPKDIEAIRHTPLREVLQKATEGIEKDQDYREALYNFALNNSNTGFAGIKRVKIYINTFKVVALANKKYVRPDGNFDITIWRNLDKSINFNIRSNFDAYTKKSSEDRHPASKKVLSLQKGDMIEVIKNNIKHTMVVRGFSGNTISVADHTAAGKAKRPKRFATERFEISNKQLERGEVIIKKLYK